MKLIYTFLLLIIWPLNTLLATDPPSLIFPANSSLEWNYVVFEWSSVANAISYEIQADTSVTFSSPVLKDSVIPSGPAGVENVLPLSSFTFGSMYYWRVRTITATDTSLWSTSGTFLTRDSIYLLSPANGAVLEAKVLLDWDSHPGVEFYDYQADTSLLFNSSLLIQGNNYYFSSQGSAYDSEHHINYLHFGCTYYWRVRARNSVDTTEWFLQSFTVLPAPEIQPTNGVTQLVGDKVNWDSFAGTFHYNYQIDKLANFSSPALLSGLSFFMLDDDNNSDTEYSPAGLEFGTEYFWRVRSLNYLDTSAWTGDYFYTYPTVDVSSPNNNAITGTTVTIDWQPHTGVNYYQYQLDTTPLFNSALLQQGQNVYINAYDGNQDTRHTFQNLYYGTTYYWRVRAGNQNDISDWSEVRNFHSAAVLELFYPMDGANTFTEVNFSWEDLEGATHFQVQVDTLASFTSGMTEIYTISGSGVFSLSNLYFGKQYFWRVRAINMVDTTLWSATYDYYTYDLVGLFTPDQAEINVDTAVTLDWMAHTGAFAYEFQVDTSNTFTTAWLIQGLHSYLGSSSGLSDTEYDLVGLEENQYYFWRVRVMNEKDTSSWEERWFSTGSIPLVLPQPPALISPLHNEINVTINPLLLWSSVPDAAGYYYQISKDYDFATAMVYYTTDPQHQMTSLDYLEDYYWRVRTFDGNLISSWSSIYHFKTNQEKLVPPVLLSPVTGLVSQPVEQLAFNWTDVYHANYYRIELSTTDNFLFNLIQEQVSSSYFMATSLLPGENYFWRVKAMNDTLINSEWSEVWTFRTLDVLDFPSLTSPINLANGQVLNNLMLDWEDVNLADAYEIEYAIDEYFLLNPVHEVNVVSYFILSSLNPVTTYYWRVRAIADTMYHSDWSYVWNFTTTTQIGIGDIIHAHFQVFPNPVQDIVTISSPSSLGRIQLVGIDSKIIFETECMEKEFRLDMSGLASGVYFLRINQQELTRLLKLE
ncbi:MAG: hypothetical protein K9I34_02145 [Bacteroidales bacterium]|nr:hypothetical protein [Bacteroidales bacterium]